MELNFKDYNEVNLKVESHNNIDSGLEYYGKVRCPLYDTIPFTASEKWVIDTPEFQRLRRIKQTAFTHFVFPGATHSRFEHSLGVMHMAGIFLSTLLKNQKVFLAKSVDRNDVPEISNTAQALVTLSREPWLMQLVRFAGLLHDIGHAPYSHSGERFLPTWSQVAEQLHKLNLPTWLNETFTRKIQKFEIQKKDKSVADTTVRHEFYSLLLIDQVFSRFSKTEKMFLSSDMGHDICALIDKDVPLRSNSLLREFGLRSLLSEIISGEIDADRMDYLQRDAKHCGVVYGLFDAGRILDASVFYQSRSSGNLHLAIRRSGIAAYEDFLRARMSMYHQVYFHKTGTACEAMFSNIRKACEDFFLPLDPSNYLQYDDQSFYYLLRDNSNSFSNVSEELESLLFSRRLWKKVYEESLAKFAQGHMYANISLSTAVGGYLKSIGVVNELVESETNLSRFSPKGRRKVLNPIDGTSENSLKVISKDVRGRISLEAIEDHSRLINNLDEERVLRRVFIKPDTKNELAKVKELVASFVEGNGF